MVGKRRFSILLVVALLVTLVQPLGSPVMKVAGAQSAIDYTKDNGKLRNVMYYADWSLGAGEENFTPDKIPADQLTHLNFAFLDFDKEGNLLFCEKDASVDAPAGLPGVIQGMENAGILPALLDLRAKNPNLRLGISVGGWTKSGDFATVASGAAIRAEFADNLADFVKYAEMDFVDIDWEYPGSRALRSPDLVDNAGDEGNPDASIADYENYILLLKEIRRALDDLEQETGKYYELSVAMSCSGWTLGNWSSPPDGTDIASLFQVVDFANVMTYDIHGAWENRAMHHTGLYSNPNNPDPNSLWPWSIHDSVTYLLAQGAVADKIVIGVAMYTRGWEQVADDGGVPGLPGMYGSASYANIDADGSITRGAKNYAPLVSGDGGRNSGIWPYRTLNELKTTYPGLVEYWDDDAKAPYLYANNGAFFTYDNPRSIAEKANYIKANGLGGFIGWMQSQDAETITGSGVRNTLTTAMKEGLYGSDSLQEYNTIITGGPALTCEIEAGDGGFSINLKNTESAVETDEVLKELEEAYQAVFSPTLYIKTKSGAVLSAGNNSGSVVMNNGVGVVNLHEVDNYTILSPGETAAFKINTNGTAAMEDLEEIILTQRVVPTGTEYTRQVIHFTGTNKQPDSNGGNNGNSGTYEPDTSDSQTSLGPITVTNKTSSESDGVTETIELINGVDSSKITVQIDRDKNKVIQNIEGTMSLEKVDAGSGQQNPTITVSKDLLKKLSEVNNTGRTINLEITLAEEMLLNIINNKSAGNADEVTINLVLPEDLDTHIKISNLLLPHSALAQSIENGRDLVVSIRNEKKEVLYQWIFPSDSKKLTEDIDLYLNPKPSHLINGSKVTLRSVLTKGNRENMKNGTSGISFNVTVPEVTLRLQVADQSGIKIGEKVYLYYYNEETRKLEDLNSTEYVVQDDGTIIITVNKKGDYVLLPYKAAKGILAANK